MPKSSREKLHVNRLKPLFETMIWKDDLSEIDIDRVSNYLQIETEDEKPTTLQPIRILRPSSTLKPPTRYRAM